MWAWLPLLAVTAGAPAAPGPKSAPVLDRQQGEQAVAAYRAALARFCAAHRDGGPAPPSEAAVVGMAIGADAGIVCQTAKWAQALASGALTRAGADEVLLQVGAGGVAAGMENQLLLMRATSGTGYRPVPWVVVGAGFQARARVLVDGRRDVLVLCEARGRQGLYPSGCGFFGQGAFRGYRPESAADHVGEGGDEVTLGYVTSCGRSEAIVFGGVVLEDGRLVMELDVQKVVRKPKGPDETPGGDRCSDEKVTSSELVRIGYQILPDTVKRATIIPKRLNDIAVRYDFY